LSERKPWKYKAFGSFEVELFIDRLKRIYKDQKIELLRLDGIEGNWVEKRSFEKIYTNLAIVEKGGSSSHFSNMLGEGFESKIPVELANLFDHKDLQTQKKKVVVVFGASGSGKSTLCKNIAFQWAKNGLWPQYKLLFHISSQTLNTDKYRKMESWSVYDILAEQYKNEDPNRIKTLIEKTGKDKILIVLDGFDELSKEGEESAFKKLKREFSHLLITSRHRNMNFKGYTSVEVMGFRDEDVRSYIRGFFGSSAGSEEKIQSLEKFVLKTPSIKDLAKVPLNLALLCMLYADRPFTQEGSFTRTDLCQLSIDRFYKWYLRKYENNINESDIKGTAAPEVHPGIRSLHQAMEKLAYEVLEKGQTEIPQKEIEKCSGVNYQKIRAIGFLILENQKGVFIHKVFQEFFAAKYLARLYEENKYEEAKKIIENKRSDPNFHPVFTLTAGCLSKKEDIIHFFDAICPSPEFSDSRTKRFVMMELILSSLNECRGIPDLMVNVNKFFEIEREDDFLDESFLFTVEENQMKSLKWLCMHYPADMNKATSDGLRLPMVAAYFGNIDILDYFYEKCPDLFEMVRTASGETSFHFSAFNGQLDAMKWLDGKDPELFKKPNNNGLTPFHVAACGGQVEAMEWLDEKDPELFKKLDNYGSTPFHEATLKGQIEAMEWLNRKDPELFKKPNNNGSTPFQRAAFNGQVEAMEWLNRKDPELFKKPNNNGCTPFHGAAFNGQVEAMEWLNRKDPELFQKPSNDGSTPFHGAAQEGQVEAMEWLDEKDPELFKKLDNNGSTPFHGAAWGGRVEAMEWLDEKDPELFKKPNNNGSTPFYGAAVNGQVEAMEWLDEKDPELFKKPDNNGITPFYGAALNGQVEAMEWLNRKDPELFKKPDNNGNTPFDLAAANEEVEAMKWFDKRSKE
jgi:ankyrin repeat protein